MTNPLYERSLYNAIEKAYIKASERKWDKIYWCIDIHETLVKPTYDENGYIEFYDSALNAIGWILSCPENRIILWSSLPTEEMQKIRRLISSDDDHERIQLNSNNEVYNTSYANFDKKFYFNILLDDKAGFDPEIDFDVIYQAICDLRNDYMEHLND